MFPNLRLRILFLVMYLVRTTLIARFHWHVQQTSACECSISVVNIPHSCTFYINRPLPTSPSYQFHLGHHLLREDMSCQVMGGVINRSPTGQTPGRIWVVLRACDPNAQCPIPNDSALQPLLPLRWHLEGGWAGLGGVMSQRLEHAPASGWWGVHGRFGRQLLTLNDSFKPCPLPCSS